MAYDQKTKDAEDRYYQERARLHQEYNNAADRKSTQMLAQDRRRMNQQHANNVATSQSDDTVGALITVLGAAAGGFLAYTQIDPEFGAAAVGALVGGVTSYALKGVIKFALGAAVILMVIGLIVENM